MALEQVEGIILRTYPLGDTSRIAVLYTLQRGLVRGVAKGSRQPRSRFAGVLEPLSRIRAMIYVKEGRELDLMSSADLVESLARVEWGLEKITHCQAAIELVDRLVWGEESHEALYYLLLKALRRLAKVPEDGLSTVTLAFQLQASALLGYRPALDRCASCGREEKTWRQFGPEEGGVLCGRCAVGETMVIGISPLVSTEFSRLLALDLESDEIGSAKRSGELLKIMEVYLQAHFQRFGGLRSLDLLRDLEAPLGGPQA